MSAAGWAVAVVIAWVVVSIPVAVALGRHFARRTPPEPPTS